MKTKLSILFLILTNILFAQNPTPFTKIKVTGAAKSNDATRVVVQDSLSKEYHWILKSTLAADANVLHKTENESASGVKTFTERVVVAGTNASTATNAVSPLNVTGGSGGSTTATTGTAIAGNAGEIKLHGGNGGNALTSSDFNIGGTAGSVYLLGGDGGLALGATTNFPGNGGNATLQGGDSYGGVPGFASLKGGNNKTAGSLGGDVYIVPGWGNDSDTNDTYNGTIYLGLSPNAISVRGNTVVGGTTDDKIHKLQVNGKGLFTDLIKADKSITKINEDLVTVGHGGSFFIGDNNSNADVLEFVSKDNDIDGFGFFKINGQVDGGLQITNFGSASTYSTSTLTKSSQVFNFTEANNYTETEITPYSFAINAGDTGISSFNQLLVNSEGVQILKPLKLYDAPNADFGSLSLTDNLYIFNGASGVNIFGVSNNSGFSALFNSDGISANRSWNLPDASGTVALSENTLNLSGNQEVNGTKEFINGITLTNSTLYIDDEEANFNIVNKFGDTLYEFAASNNGTALINSTSLTAIRNFDLINASGQIPVVRTTAPTSSTDTGVKGEIYVDASYIYYCYATNLWRRVAGSTF